MNIRKILLLFVIALSGCEYLSAQMREGSYQALKTSKENTVETVPVHVVPLGNGLFHFNEGDPRKPLEGTYRFTVNRVEYHIGNFKKGFADGDWEHFRNNKLLEKKTAYKNGLLDGKHVRYEEDGTEDYVYTYKNGLKQHYISWYSGGKKREERFYDENEYLHGEMFTFDADGNVKDEKRYRHGSREGVQVETDQDGYKVSQEYADDKKYGVYSKLYPEGNQCEKGTYDENAKKTGLWTSWYADGSPNTEEHFLNGILNGEKRTYYTGKKLKSEEDYMEGKLHGRKIEYDEDPHRVSREMTYSEGDLHGAFKIWHNGILWREGAYQDGKMIYEKEYADGKLQIVKLLDENDALIPVEKYDNTGKRTYKKTDYRRHPAVILKESASGVIDVEIK
ncbi:MAG: hypothetical protein LBV74_18115 [Tannerella sp.]|jgi:antitoxin component YwqK of YwqJK toxin-antitoxin module|nr:hypothetical protein [Tannerella sp.]